MSNVIQFPKRGEKIALYMGGYMYAGTISESEPILDRPGIWLTGAAFVPIKGQVNPAEILHLASVLVMWDKVDAVSEYPEFAIQKQP